MHFESKYSIGEWIWVFKNKEEIYGERPKFYANIFPEKCKISGVAFYKDGEEIYTQYIIDINNEEYLEEDVYEEEIKAIRSMSSFFIEQIKNVRDIAILEIENAEDLPF